MLPKKNYRLDIRFQVWGDSSKEVRGRLALLLRNGFSGLLLVFLVLTLFLEMRLAFWVALGIPISISGSRSCTCVGRSNAEHVEPVLVSCCVRASLSMMPS